MDHHGSLSLPASGSSSGKESGPSDRGIGVGAAAENQAPAALPVSPQMTRPPRTVPNGSPGSMRKPRPNPAIRPRFSRLEIALATFRQAIPTRTQAANRRIPTPPIKSFPRSSLRAPLRPTMKTPERRMNRRRPAAARKSSPAILRPNTAVLMDSGITDSKSQVYGHSTGPPGETQVLVPLSGVADFQPGLPFTPFDNSPSRK